MRKFIFYFLVLSLINGCSSLPDKSQSSIHNNDPKIERIQIQSNALSKRMNVAIYLPSGYSKERLYPVLYLLHGQDGNENSWIKDMKVDEKATKLIDSHQIAQLIIVMPNYGNSYGTNYSTKTKTIKGMDYGMYGDFITKDLVYYIDSNYSTIKSREGRFIGGLSMGGFAALQLAFNHIDLFSKAGGHSPAMFLDSTPDLKWLYDNEEMRKVTDPLAIAKVKILKNLKIYLDHADNDMGHVIDSSKILYDELMLQRADVQFHTSPGGHDKYYWKSNTEAYLKFYSGK